MEEFLTLCIYNCKCTIYVVYTDYTIRSNVWIEGRWMFFTGEWSEYIYAYRRKRRKDLENFIKKHYIKKMHFWACCCSSDIKLWVTENL